MMSCMHLQLEPGVYDQTLGVRCFDCGLLLAYCWMDNHVAEDVWNQACRQTRERGDADAEDWKPCADVRQVRHCAICEETF